MGIHLDLGFDETESFRRTHNLNKLAPAKGALVFLRGRLPGLTRVHLSVGFLSGPLSDKLVRRRVVEFADMVMGLAELFAPGVEVVVSNKDKQQCRKDIMAVCREKIEDLTTKRDMDKVQEGLENINMVEKGK